MTQLAIAYVDGRYQCYATDNGIERRNVGPKWVTPREASTFIDSLAAIPNVSPLRDPVPSLEQDELTAGLGADVDGSPAPSGAPDNGGSIPVRSGASPGFWPD
jgi:hypothetical protein